MIDNAKMEEIMKGKDFPLVEGVYVESSNVNGNTASASAITKVTKVSERKRLDALTNLCTVISSEAKTVRGISFACTERWSVADDLANEYAAYGVDDKFEVIWLNDTVMSYEYRGNAGHVIHRLRGIVIRYPDEFESVA